MNSPHEFDRSPPDKRQVVDDLLDDLMTPENVPLHDWQVQELARRRANLASKSVPALTWDEVKRRIRSRYGR